MLDDPIQTACHNDVVGFLDLLRGNKTAVSQQSKTERDKINGKLRECDWSNSDVARYFEQRRWDRYEKRELLGIAIITSRASGIGLDREDKRRKTCLRAWFVHHFQQLKDYLDNVEIEEESE